jgi:hypothetical protein
MIASPTPRPLMLVVSLPSTGTITTYSFFKKYKRSCYYFLKYDWKLLLAAKICENTQIFKTKIQMQNSKVNFFITFKMSFTEGFFT